jgi:hypothetical protein
MTSSTAGLSGAYAGVLGALLAGHGYVPLNRTFPVERTRIMLKRSMCRSIVVDTASEAQLDALLGGIETSLLLLSLISSSLPAAQDSPKG